MKLNKIISSSIHMLPTFLWNVNLILNQFAHITPIDFVSASAPNCILLIHRQFPWNLIVNHFSLHLKPSSSSELMSRTERVRPQRNTKCIFSSTKHLTFHHRNLTRRQIDSYALLSINHRSPHGRAEFVWCWMFWHIFFSRGVSHATSLVM